MYILTIDGKEKDGAYSVQDDEGNHVFQVLATPDPYKMPPNPLKSFSGPTPGSKLPPKSSLGNDSQRTVHNFWRPECSRTFVRSTFE